MSNNKNSPPPIAIESSNIVQEFGGLVVLSKCESDSSIEVTLTRDFFEYRLSLFKIKFRKNKFTEFTKNYKQILVCYSQFIKLIENRDFSIITWLSINFDSTSIANLFKRLRAYILED